MISIRMKQKMTGYFIHEENQLQVAFFFE